ncbi:fructose-bisphosphatase class II [Agromyces sp. SYSU T00194]|uniref:fructose-bisphosphatase class II n=1 Tax=Agromyces chitinivorans TaxID=3158560 RepID=UPI00339A0825
MTHFESPVVHAFERAVAAAAWAAMARVDGGDGHAVDAVAVDALRAALSGVPVDGRVVAGEGEKDDAPMLAPGERFGTGGPAVDIVVDPVDGTRLAASGRPGAMAILAAAPRGAFLDIGPAFYMDKLVCGADAAGLAIDAPPAENLQRLAAAIGCPVRALRVAVQERPRNAALAAAVRAAGAEVVAFEHGDIERAVQAAQPGGDLDLLLGIGGAPEGVIEAAAVRALGGTMQARFAPQSDEESARVRAAGVPVERALDRDELCAGEAMVFVSPVTRCDFGEPDAAAVRVVAARA